MKIIFFHPCSVESGRQHETEVKTRCKTDGDSCLEADSKPLMSESFELEKSVLFNVVQA